MEEALISCIINSYKCEICLLTGDNKGERVLAYLSRELYEKDTRLMLGAKLRANLERGRYIIRDYAYINGSNQLTSGGIFDYK